MCPAMIKTSAPAAWKQRSGNGDAVSGQSRAVGYLEIDHFRRLKFDLRRASQISFGFQSRRLSESLPLSPSSFASSPASFRPP